MPACEICKAYAQLRPFSLPVMRQLEGYVQARRSASSVAPTGGAGNLSES